EAIDDRLGAGGKRPGVDERTADGCKIMDPQPHRRGDAAETDGIDRRESDQPPLVAANRSDADTAVEMIDGRKQHAGMEEAILLGTAAGETPPFLDQRGGLRRRQQRQPGPVATGERDTALDTPVS